MKKNILIVVCACLVISAGFLSKNFFNKNIEQPSTSEEQSVITDIVDNEKTAVKEDEIVNEEENNLQKISISKTSITKTAQPNKTIEKIKKGNLYKDITSNALPLSAMCEISSLPENVKASVEKIVNNSNEIYMLKHNNDKVLMVIDSQDNTRHGIDFVEISTHSGHQKVTSFGYLDKMKDYNNDNWKYDEDTNKPLKHIIYNKDGDVELIETWNYSDSEPIKYELKDGEGNTISLKKETVDNDSNNLRVEHLIYDKNGNTKINISTTYEGADIKRFTYYNAEKPAESGSVFSEYKDGNKIKETLYTSDLKVKNVYTSDYTDGARENITVYDNNNNKVEKLTEQ